MAQLPVAFTEKTRQLMGEERFERYLQSFEEEPPVSIRVNTLKMAEGSWKIEDATPVPWCRNAFYLQKRPNFTMDPLLHAGCYYVQEAASMFLPIRNRANILLENVTKWGYENHIVTNNYPKDYRRSKLRFDLILCDVPCSGEGMFRKDEATIREWSEQNVEKCWQLQREIIDDAWACLNPGGLLIYSTCTFNTKENEENIRYFLEQYDDHEPVYRFIPGITRSEGLFMCVLRKRGEKREVKGERSDQRQKQERALTILSPLTTLHSPLQVPLTYHQAIAYLRHEALVLPEETPRGLVTVCFQDHPLGLVKNIGSRANNLYPKEWKIKTTHIPNDYEAILRHTESNTD